jgi:glutaconate CoA-transferase subunit A
MGKVMNLHDAVEKFVRSGDTICLGGFTTNRKPYAAVYEILRQGQTDFTVWAGPAGGDWDMLIGEGRVKAYINCYTANSGYTNVSRRFRAAIEEGKLVYEDYSQDVLMLQLHAASLGLPFLPVRLMAGSGLVDFWGISKEQRKTLDTVDNDKLVIMENPFEPGQKVVAVPVPKIDTAIIHVQKASPDGTCIIEGDEFHDVDIAVAARKVIVTCDELVSNEFIRRDPTLTRIFGECVSAVVHAPYGAWPSQCYNYYDNDPGALREYDKASKYMDAEDAKAQLAKAAAKAAAAAAKNPDDAKLAEAAAKAAKVAEDAANGTAIPETFKDYLDKWVYSVEDHQDLLNKIGGARLMSLRNAPHLGYSNTHLK